MRTLLVVLWMLLGAITSAAAQVSVGIGMPGVSIGINLPVYPAAGPGARLSGLLRAANEFELFLLRRPVLGLPARQLVREFLVQRPMGTGGPGGRAAVRPARSRALLPATSCVLSRMAFGCAAALGRALGQRVVAESQRMEQLESQRGPRAGAVAFIPAAILG